MTVADQSADIASARPWAKTAALTVLALLAFAANSIVSRMGLGRQLIDAATFTGARLVAGTVVLGGLTLLRSKGWQPLGGGGWRGPLALFGYAAPFSLAYGRIGAAVGALILFGSVQLTMIGWGLVKGAHSFFGAALMAVALVVITAATNGTDAAPEGLGISARLGFSYIRPWLRDLVPGAARVECSGSRLPQTLRTPAVNSRPFASPIRSPTSLAEAHGNRTHRRRQNRLPTVLKTAGRTSVPRASGSGR